MEKRMKSKYGDDNIKKCETKSQRSLASIEQRNAQIRRVKLLHSFANVTHFMQTIYCTIT